MSQKDRDGWNLLMIIARYLPDIFLEFWKDVQKAFKGHDDDQGG